MTEEEIGSSIESAMKQRTKAKQSIACAQEKLESIKSSIEALNNVRLIPGDVDLSHVERGCLRVRSCGRRTDEWKTVKWPEINEIKRLIMAMENGQKELQSAEKRLSDLGTPI